MKIQRAVLSTTLLAMSLSVAIPVSVQAALPAMVDNQALPSLAPMLERATPAVVNIATENRVASRRDPLLEDPFFRHFFNIPTNPASAWRKVSGPG